MWRIHRLFIEYCTYHLDGGGGVIRLPIVGIMYTRRRCDFISSFEFQVNLYDKMVVGMGSKYIHSS